MSNPLQEKAYIIAEDAQGKLYFYINAKENDPQKYPDPKVIYDGKEHAILKRNPEQDIILDYITEEKREDLKKAYTVTIIESIKGNITQTYHAMLEHVESLPISLNI